MSIPYTEILAAIGGVLCSVSIYGYIKDRISRKSKRRERSDVYEIVQNQNRSELSKDIENEVPLRIRSYVDDGFHYRRQTTREWA